MYVKGMYVNGSKTPMKPRNIRIQSSIPTAFAVVIAIYGVWLLSTGREPLSGWMTIAMAGFFHFMSWVGFLTARIREQWERENPDLAKNIDY